MVISSLYRLVTVEPPVVYEVHELFAADPQTDAAGAIEQARNDETERHVHALSLPLVTYCDAQCNRDDGANYCPC